ncbi:MAG: SPOR domain-containing protein, partial [Desulfobacterales bacterium]
IKPEKQLGTDQNLIDVNRQNELKPKVQIKRPGPLETNYFVQVGAFRNKENADKIVRKLKLKGYTAETVTLTDSKDRQWHTVRIGEHVSLNAAKKHAADFSNKEKMDSIVLPLKKQ